MKLFEGQKAALAQLAADPAGASAHQLNAPARTLNSLVKAGLATANGEAAGIASRYTRIYRVSEDGLALVRGEW